MRSNPLTIKAFAVVDTIKIDDVCDIIKYDRLNERFKAVVDAGVVVYESK